MLNSLITASLPLVPKPVVRFIANKYIAGESLQEAVQTVKQLNAHKAMATIDVLGEFVENKAQAEHSVAMSSSVLTAVHQHQLRSGLSVKLTSLGMDIDNEWCYTNLKSLVAQANDLKLFVRIDMENSPYTDRTLDMYRRLRAEGLDNCGVVIQAYMKRSEEDIKSLIPLKPSIRLCKGIYVEDASIAFKEYEQVRANYKKLLRIILDNGMSIGIATHDDALIDDAMKYIQTQKPEPERFEFQMLLGVREKRRDEIIASGNKMRIYVPFGEDWYGYSVRRLKENPQVAGHVFKAIFTGD